MSPLSAARRDGGELRIVPLSDAETMLVVSSVDAHVVVDLFGAYDLMTSGPVY